MFPFTTLFQNTARVNDTDERTSLLSSLPASLQRSLAGGSSSSSGKGKKVTLADYQRSRIEELVARQGTKRGGGASELDTDAAARELADATTNPERMGLVIDYDTDSRRARFPAVGSRAQEEDALRKEVLEAFHGMSDDDDEEEEEEEGGGLKLKKKSDQAQGEEEEDDELFVAKHKAQAAADQGSASYRAYLLEALGGDEAAVREALREEMSSAAQFGAGGEDDAPATAGGAEGEEAKSTKKSKKSKSKESAATSAAEQAQKARSKEEENERFLMDYILNRGWVDPADGGDAGNAKQKKKAQQQQAGTIDLAPSTSGAKSKGKASGEGGGRDWEAEAAELSSEASFDSQAEAFENAYNFRYEAIEAGAASGSIPTYARDAAGVNSVRRASERETKRKAQREERKARKEAEKAAKMAELEKAKEKKKRAIVDRLKQLRDATGSNAIGFEDLNLDDDFDPAAHDKAMEAAFNDEYYQEEDLQFDADGKPIWDDDGEDEIDVGDIEDEEEEAADVAPAPSKGKRKAANDEEDGRIEMDADFVDGEGAVDLSGLSKKDRKKLKKKEKKQQQKLQAKRGDDDEDAADGEGVDEEAMDADVGPSAEELAAMTPTERKKTLGDMLDSYYSMDYEDMVSRRGMAGRRPCFSLAESTHAPTPLVDRRPAHTLQVRAGAQVQLRHVAGRNPARGRRGAEQRRRHEEPPAVPQGPQAARGPQPQAQGLPAEARQQGPGRRATARQRRCGRVRLFAAAERRRREQRRRGEQEEADGQEGARAAQARCGRIRRRRERRGGRPAREAGQVVRGLVNCTSPSFGRLVYKLVCPG